MQIPLVFERGKVFVMGHKKIVIGVLCILAIGGYFIFRTSSSKAETSYLISPVEKGTIIASITGSGQVESSDQIDLKSRSSGEITRINAHAGQTVHRGQTLFVTDTRDAEKLVRDAETSLELTQLDLDKFTAPPENTAVQSLQNAMLNAEKTKHDAATDVAKAYQNLLNSSVDASADTIANSVTPPTITGTYTKGEEVTITISVYQTADSAYWSASSDPSGLVTGSGIVSSASSQPIGDSGLFIKFSNTTAIQPKWVIEIPNKTVAAYASNLVAYQTALANQEKVDRDADLSVAQAKEDLNTLYHPDDLELRTKQLAVKQKQDALEDAKSALADCYVTAPFAGTIATVTAKVGDTASGILGTLITDQKVATISLNEVDISKIKLGQKATLTFDALDDFSLTGEVADIDVTGTVSQGVVNYNVKIAFDTDSEKVKPGMSVSAAIIIDTKQDVLTVPVSAVKNGANGSYVEKFPSTVALTASASGQGVLSKATPEQVPVETGISDDTSIEIVSGLSEGEKIISRTITAAKPTTATQAPSLLGGGGARLGGGGNRSFSGGAAFGR